MTDSRPASKRLGLRALLATFIVAAGIAVWAVPAVAAASPAPVSGGPGGTGVCATQAGAVKAGIAVNTLRAFADCEIARRQTSLTALSAAVTASKVVTSGHAATIQSLISADKSGLASLKTTIDAETSLPALRADVTKIVSDYRVYVLLALTPAQFNGGTAGPVLASAKTALTTARADLKTAVADGQAVIAALK